MWLCPCWEQGDDCIPYKLYWELNKFRTVGTLSMCPPRLMPLSSLLPLLHLLTIIIWALNTRKGLLSWVSHAACFKISMADLYFFITYLCIYSISTGELKHKALLKVNKYFVFCTAECLPVSCILNCFHNDQIPGHSVTLFGFFVLFFWLFCCIISTITDTVFLCNSGHL